MDGSERKEKNERQQGAAEEKERDNGVMGKKKNEGGATEQIIAIMYS
jgi:hypothetical protein